MAANGNGRTITTDTRLNIAVVMILVAITMAAAFTKYQGDASAQAIGAITVRIDRMDKDFIPRPELEAMFLPVQRDIADMKADLKEALKERDKADK